MLSAQMSGGLPSFCMMFETAAHSQQQTMFIVQVLVAMKVCGQQ